MKIKHGSFVANTSIGQQAVTGVGFQPEAVIFYSSSQTAAGYQTDSNASLGVASGAGVEVSYAVARVDNSAAGWVALSETKCISLVSTTALDGEADLVSFDADGFTIDWTDAPATAVIIQFIAIDGVTNAKAGAFTTPADPTTGNVATTGVGFQPDFILFFNGLQTAAGNSSLANMPWNIGFASSATARGAIGSVAAAGATQDTTKCLLLNGVGQGAGGADLTSFDADGFTLNWAASPFTARRILYLALKSASGFKVGTETSSTTVGTKATTGVGFEPDGVIFMGLNGAVRPFFGAGDGASEGFIWHNFRDTGSGRMDRAHTLTKSVRHATGPSTTNEEADLSALGADGFTLDWTTASGAATGFLYAAFKADVAAAPANKNKLILLGVGKA